VEKRDTGSVSRIGVWLDPLIRQRSDGRTAGTLFVRDAQESTQVEAKSTKNNNKTGIV